MPRDNKTALTELFVQALDDSDSLIALHEAIDVPTHLHMRVIFALWANDSCFVAVDHIHAQALIGHQAAVGFVLHMAEVNDRRSCQYICEQLANGQDTVIAWLERRVLTVLTTNLATLDGFHAGEIGDAVGKAVKEERELMAALRGQGAEYVRTSTDLHMAVITRAVGSLLAARRAQEGMITDKKTFQNNAKLLVMDASGWSRAVGNAVGPFGLEGVRQAKEWHRRVIHNLIELSERGGSDSVALRRGIDRAIDWLGKVVERLA